jgi:H+-translocating NAD(P) transhydrogenase subunit alpha
MDPSQLTDTAAQLANEANAQAAKARLLAEKTAMLAQQGGGGVDILTMGITVFALACFVGYYVVWRVTPALHSPLMAVTNAISSVIIVGALLAAGASQVGFSRTMGFLAIILASVNIFGGFVVTQRMLGKFKKKEAAK